MKVTLSHIGVVLGFAELLKALDYVGEHFYFFLPGELRVEVVGLEWFLEQGEHH